MRSGHFFARAAVVAALVAGSLAAAAERRAATPSEREAIRSAFRAELAKAAQPIIRVEGVTASPEAALGERLFSDPNLSLRRNQSCASCHQLTPAKDPTTGRYLPTPGFVDADNVERRTPVSDGSVSGRFGRLNAPSAGYAAFSPPFHFDRTEGLYVGGQFWNGRSSTLSDQAGQPFLNPAEMAMPGKAAVVDRLKESAIYKFLFDRLYKLNIDRRLSPAETNAVYDAMTRAIAAFERTTLFNRFTSKFDYAMVGRVELSSLERQGLQLFDGKAKCAGCHISTPTRGPDGRWTPALFTDFTYDNIGVPRNLDIPGDPEPDKGLGGRPDIVAGDPQGLEIGKHKVMSLRNIAITPPYGHNGVFRTLEQITHFYNTRDTLGFVPNNHHRGFGITGWPHPEAPRNVNVDELGHLGLTAKEEAALVAFMKTLTDGYQIWGHDPRAPPGAAPPYNR